LEIRKREFFEHIFKAPATTVVGQYTRQGLNAKIPLAPTPANMVKSRLNQKNKSPSSVSNKVAGIFDWCIIAVVGLVAIVVIIGYFVPAKEPPLERKLPGAGDIKVQLFGGCGRSSVVTHIVDLLRKTGIDVVDIEEESGFIYPSCLVIDRRGNPALADSLAKVLALPNDRIVQQRYDLVVDATIVIGLDYPRIIKKLEPKG